jgi:hypothetical protein
MTRAAYADLVTQITVDGISSLGGAASRSLTPAR